MVGQSLEAPSSNNLSLARLQIYWLHISVFLICQIAFYFGLFNASLILSSIHFKQQFTEYFYVILISNDGDDAGVGKRQGVGWTTDIRL